jgi:transcription elongation factor Elf1
VERHTTATVIEATMNESITDKRIHCPFCAEPTSIVIDLSAGDQSYIEDCQVCCQPMQVTFETDQGELLTLSVDRAG